jgi:hypothetical protein
MCFGAYSLNGIDVFGKHQAPLSIFHAVDSTGNLAPAGVDQSTYWQAATGIAVSFSFQSADAGDGYTQAESQTLGCRGHAPQ